MISIRSILLALILIANTALAQDSVRLSGTILHPASDSISVSYNSSRLAYYPNEYYARLNKKGSFSIAFPVPGGVYTQATIVHGNSRAEVMLQGGDKLVMNVDAAHFDTSIHYSGKGSEIQNFVAKHTLARGLTNQYSLKLKEQIHYDPADFLKAIDKELKTETAFLDKSKGTLPVSFIKYWTAFYQYYNYFFLQQYPQIHEMVRLRRYTDTIPGANYAVIKEMPYAFNDTMLQVPSYLLYLTGAIDIKLKAAGYSFYRSDTMHNRMAEDSVNKLAYELMTDRSAEFFTAQNIYGRAKMQEITRTEDQFSVFKKHWPQSEYMPLLNSQVGIAERLAPGQEAPDFDIVTSDGKHTKLSELRGKVVYLGFWAGWCRQCVGEMISERKVKELLMNKPVAFVYLSIGDDTTMEKVIIQRYKMTGMFGHVAGWSAPEVKMYGVQSLPAYYLIDEDGKFALQNAPAPGQSTQLAVEIGKLLR